MSRLPWREQAFVWLAPSEVGLVLRRRGLRPSVERHSQSTRTPGGAEAAMESLAELGALAAPHRAYASVVVSNRFVRTALLAEGHALRGNAERQVAAREVLRGIHGDTVDGWSVVVEPVAARGLPAAALEAGWLQRLRHTARQAGLRAGSVRPLLALAAQHAWEHVAGQHVWLLVTEPDGALLARIDAEGGWQSLRSLPFDALRGPSAMQPWLERSMLVDGTEPTELPLVHVVWNGVALSGGSAAKPLLAESAGWRIRTIALDATDL